MRARLALAGAAIAILLAGAAATQADAAARRGVIVVKHGISLKFPRPGVYTGKVTLGAALVKKPARSKRGTKASKKMIDDVRDRAGFKCEIHAEETPVQITHLSMPPFLIGAQRPQAHWLGYRVKGREPPKGDRVRASQNARTVRFRAFHLPWEVWCRRAQVIKPYPY